MSAPEDRIRAEDLTAYLADLGRGVGAEATVLPYVIEELRGLARRHMQRQTPGHTLQTSALVNEAYIKLFAGAEPGWKDRAHFFALAAKAMRQVLIDHARRKHSLKRGGGEELVTLYEPAAGTGEVSREIDALDLEAALVELAELDARQAQVVEMRYYGGLEVAEVAAALSVSVTTVEREWRAARAWLGRKLGPGRASSEGAP